MAKTPSKIDYEHLVQNALRSVVKETLQNTAKNGLPGSHHFYISYRTNYPGVDLPDYLRSQYPEEITIVLQHEFWDLEVEETGFSVTLSFNDVHERLTIPWGAIVNFVDPSVKFGLQFQPSIYEESKPAKKIPKKATKSKKTEAKTEKKEAAETATPTTSNVIALDAFRRK